MQIGIRELKSKLSEYVRRAQDGEEITVTDHGTPMARLAPLFLYPDAQSDTGSALGEPTAEYDTKMSRPSARQKARDEETYASLLLKAQRQGKHATQKETLTAALKEYVRRQGAEAIIAAFGTIEFDPDWDYKKLRRIKSRLLWIPVSGQRPFEKKAAILAKRSWRICSLRAMPS
jgi:prevent-host-death family protein